MNTLQAQRYTVDMPLATHWRPATCEEVDCKYFVAVWRVNVPKGSPGEAKLRISGRPFHEQTESNGTVTFEFPKGTPCLEPSRHRIQTERPANYLYGSESTPGRIVGEDEWQGRFVTNLDDLKRIQG